MASPRLSGHVLHAGQNKYLTCISCLKTNGRIGVQSFRDLQEEFRTARENDHLAKIEALELEMDELTNAVTEATGLGGRSRQKTDMEKIRKSVREAISRDMRRIGKKHELQGKHLTTFIDTCSTCRYFPEPPFEWVT